MGVFVNIQDFAGGSGPTEARGLAAAFGHQFVAEIAVEEDLEIPRAMSKTFSGFTSMAAPPTTSGRELTCDAITGVPEAIASSGGRPKPS